MQLVASLCLVMLCILELVLSAFQSAAFTPDRAASPENEIHHHEANGKLQHHRDLLDESVTYAQPCHRLHTAVKDELLESPATQCAENQAEKIGKE